MCCFRLSFINGRCDTTLRLWWVHQVNLPFKPGFSASDLLDQLIKGDADVAAVLKDGGVVEVRRRGVH